jgi:hypothetical protein
MAGLTKDQESYIEHEVKLRGHDALFKHIVYKFDKLEGKVDAINGKFNWIIALIISAIIVPIALHYFKLV